MQHFTEKTLLNLQKEFKQFTHIQFSNMGKDPKTFKQELKILQCFNIIDLKPSDITKAQWPVINPAADAKGIKTIELNSILTKTADLGDKAHKHFKSMVSPWVYIPSLNVAGLYNKATDKILLNNDTIIREPFLSKLKDELKYIKLNAVPTLLPTMAKAHTTAIKNATKSSRKRGFTLRPVIGDKFKIRSYADMKKEFGEKSGTIQVENDDGNLEPLELKLIPSSTPLYGSPFVKMWDSICDVEGTITGFDKSTGVIKANYSINKKKVTSITTILDNDGEEIELEEPLVIHEHHIIKI